MKHRKTSLTLGLGATVLLSASAASANYAYRNVAVDPIYRQFVTLNPAQGVVLETRNLSAGCDTVVHVMSNATGKEIAFNDDSAGTLASRVEFVNTGTASQSYTIYVRRYGGTSTCTADLYKGTFYPGVSTARPSLWFAGIAAGGFKAYVPNGAFLYETALTPGGVRDTLLFGLDASGHIVATDDDSGVGLASRLGGAGYQYMLVTPYWGHAAGTANLYVNDSLNDADGDGLGGALEGAIGTLDRPPNQQGYQNTKDTDRDGIPDAYEVFGLETAQGTELLSAWGANPLHKDIFVEVDRRADSAYALTAADAARIQAYFDAGPADHLQNVDGRPGVSVHLDIGVANNTTNTTYGDWGGASTNVPVEVDYVSGSADYRRASRRQIFRYALATGGAGGQTLKDQFSWGTGWSSDPRTFTHELGHTLTLAHSGHPTWGALNCNPVYQSLMNYAGPDAFSLGLSSAVINPADLNESSGVGSSTNAYLNGHPFYFATSGAAIDWNRDGQYTTSVRAAPTWATAASCGAFDQNVQNLESGTEGQGLSATGNTPALARIADRLYAFWVRPDGTLVYKHGQVSAGTANGSCPGGQRLGDPCMSWSGVAVVPTSDRVAGFGVASFQDQMVIAYRALNSSAVRVVVASERTPTSALAGWSADQVVHKSGGPAYTWDAPELEVMNLAETQALALFFPNPSTGNYEWLSSSSPLAGWADQGTVLDSSGAAIQGTMSPTVSTRGSGTATEHCGVFPTTQGAIRFFCYDRPANRWVDHSGAAFSVTPFGGAGVTLGKPGVAFHVLRDGQGAAIGGTLYGQWFITANRGPFQDVLISNARSLFATPDTVRFPYHGKVGSEWNNLTQGTGVSLYEDPTLGSLKAVQSWETLRPGQIQFLPFADGTFSTSLKDGSDFRMMERGICLGLRSEAECGTAAQTVSGL